MYTWSPYSSSLFYSEPAGDDSATKEGFEEPLEASRDPAAKCFLRRLCRTLMTLQLKGVLGSLWRPHGVATIERACVREAILKKNIFV